MEFDLALLNGKVFTNGKISEVNVYVLDGKISNVSRSTSYHAEQEIDCSGLLVLPGVIDSHVHFRDPGMTQKEDWSTGSKSAAAGGVCTVIDMPNTIPATTTAKLLEEKKEIAKKKSIVDFRLNFGATAGNLAEFAKAKGIAGLKIFMGASTGDLLLDKDDDILNAFKATVKKGVPAVVHAEDEEIIKKCTAKVKAAGRNDALAHCEARPVEAAVRAVERVLSMAAVARNNLHILHVSSEAELSLVSEAKKKGINVTCEATPHHLFLSSKDMNRLGNFAKMNPPLRSDRDRFALLRALESGLVDTVGSDHAPHLPDEKLKNVWNAPSGVPGVQTLLPLLLNEYSKGNLSLRRVVEATAASPAKIFNLLNKGEITIGYDADFSVVDPGKEWAINDDFILSKCGWTPFHGMKVTGSVEKTIVKGKVVFDNGEIIA